jgi:ethanolamine phosphate phosphodiesterase
MGVAQALSKNIRKDYANAFGPFNQRIIVRNHTFICLDAPALVDEDYLRAAQGSSYGEWQALNGGPVSFVKSLPPGKVCP